ncbi:chromosome partitioning protein ParA [Vibrio sp. RC27]
MSKSEQLEDDVVVIEQRDKRTYIYIAITGVLGIAMGGLLGSTLTSGQWESAYHTLQEKNEKLENIVANRTILTEDQQRSQFEQLQEEFNSKLKQQQEIGLQQVESLEEQVSLLVKQNENLLEQIETQTGQIEKVKQQNQRLNNQADLQSSILDRSRQVFQRELTISQELSRLESEKENLASKLQNYTKKCDDYLTGENYQGNDDACIRQDETSARLSEINQLIRVHQMDLKQIQSLTEQMGL